MAAEKFPEQAFHPVATHRLAQALGDHQPQSWMIRRTRGQAEAEVGRMQPFAPGLGRKKIPPPAEAIRLGEAGLAFSGRGGAGGSRLTGLTRGVAQRSSLDPLCR